MAEKILLLIEGEKTEKSFFENYNKSFLGKDVEIVSLRCNIYSLYQLMKSYDFDIEIEKAILEAPNCSETDKAKVRGKKFPSKYCIFDFDFQENSMSSKGKIDAVNKLIELFNNDTEYGLLFINYPRFESIREQYKRESLEGNTFDPFNKLCYKQQIESRGRKLDFDKLKFQDYGSLLKDSLKMTNYILSKEFSISKKTIHEDTAKKLFGRQVERLKEKNCVYCVNTSIQIPCYFSGINILKKI